MPGYAAPGMHQVCNIRISLQAMKVISERISILKKEELLSIVILPTTDRKKLGLMMLWLMAWSVCGLIVMGSYFSITDEKSRLFIIVYLSFWAYFEINILRAYIWKKWGREKLWIQNGVFHYQREINQKGKIKEYSLDLMSKLELVELRKTSLTDTLNQSFWVKGGERLSFKYQGKEIRIGMQINDEEARSVMRELNKMISLA
jgi:hypothetical protein